VVQTASDEICNLTDYTALDQISCGSIAPVLGDGALGATTPLFDMWYDKAGRVNKVVDPNSIQTNITNNELDQHTQETSNDFGTRKAT